MQVFAQRYGFLAGLVGAVLAGIFLPLPGRGNTTSLADWLPLTGVWLVFFRQGISLPTRELAAGRDPLRLHAFVLGWNFLLFPLATAGLLLLAGAWAGPELRMGFRLLSIMPTTIASAIALTTASGGNTANAIFSTVYSNLFAVVWVPLASLLYLSLSGGPQPGLVEMLTKLGLLIALPLFLGQVARRALPGPANRLSASTPWFCPMVILLLVYEAFSESVQSGGLAALPFKDLAGATTLSSALLLLVSGLAWWSAGQLRLSRESRIAAFYCASQKSLATGLPLATTVIAASGRAEDTALLLLPMLLFHPMQLLLAGLLQVLPRKKN